MALQRGLQPIYRASYYVHAIIYSQVQVVHPEGVRKAQVQVPLPSGHAVLNESNNMEWHVTVASGAEQELKLVYVVEHPVQDHVKGLPTRV